MLSHFIRHYYNNGCKSIVNDYPKVSEGILGENLEVIKLLHCNYHGKIKIKYIEPSYNTGNNFVYRDNFSIMSVSHCPFYGGVNFEN